MLRDFDEVAGKGEAANVVQELVQLIEELQQEPRDARHGAADIADRHDARAVELALLPLQLEQHAVIAVIAAHGAADVQLAPVLHLAPAGVKRHQPAADLLHDAAHLLAVAAVQIAEPGPPQPVFAKLLGSRRALQRKLLLDIVPHLLEQPGPAFLEGLSGAAAAALPAHCLDLRIHTLDAHLLEHALGIEAALGEEADVLDADLHCRLLHGERQRGAVAGFQHGQQVSAVRLPVLLRLLPVPAVVEAFEGEEFVEDAGEAGLFLGRLGQRHGEGVVQALPVRPAHQPRRLHCIQRLGNGNADIGPAQSGEEIGEGAFHQARAPSAFFAWRVNP